MNKLNKNSGFTIIEILVVISILSIMGVLFTDIFARSNKGGNKAQVISRIKQNGQNIIDIMDKTIRNSAAVICRETNEANRTEIIVVVDKNKDKTYTRFIISWEKPSNPTDNGYILADNAERCSDALNPAQINYLTDRDKKSGTSVKSGLFGVNELSGYTEAVSINFKLGPGVESQVSLTDTIDPVEFSTTVNLRQSD